MGQPDNKCRAERLVRLTEWNLILQRNAGAVRHPCLLIKLNSMKAFLVSRSSELRCKYSDFSYRCEQATKKNHKKRKMATVEHRMDKKYLPLGQIE
jgi:hypothetical protein